MNAINTQANPFQDLDDCIEELNESIATANPKEYILFFNSTKLGMGTTSDGSAKVTRADKAAVIKEGETLPEYVNGRGEPAVLTQRLFAMKQALAEVKSARKYLAILKAEQDRLALKSCDA